MRGSFSAKDQSLRYFSELRRANGDYFYTQACHLAAAAALEFSERGYPVMEMEGGFETWKEYGLPVQKGTLAKKVVRKPAPKPIKRAEPAAEQPQTAASTETVTA